MKSASKKDKAEGWHRHYTDLERRILVQLVLDRIDILEQNMKDQYTQECKQEAWAEVVQRFNTDVRCSHQRDTKQIKKLWDNIKTRAKRMVTDQRLQKSMRGELSTVASAGTGMLPAADSGHGTDLDALAEDSIAEKVLYYMKMTTQSQSSSQTNTTTYTIEIDDDDEEEDVKFMAESEYESIARSENAIICDDQQQSCPPAPKRFGLESQTQYRDPPHKPLRAFPGTASETSAEFMGLRSFMDQTHESISSESTTHFATASTHAQQTVIPPSSSAHAHADQRPFAENRLSASSALSSAASRATLPTTSTTAPSYNGGWVMETESTRQRDEGTGRSIQSPATAKNSSRNDRQTLKRLRKEECELKIRKLRLEIKYARIEHEERLKVIRAQRDVLNSLKPNPASIIGSLFK